MADSRFASYFFMLLGIIAIIGSVYASMTYPREIVSLVFPMLPVVMLVLSILMFLAGYYWFKARIDEEARMAAQRERDMLQKIVRKVAKGKPGA